MFRKNVISTRELLSDSCNDKNEKRNLSFEHSQHSQMEFSLINTQDMFTQHSGGTQSEKNTFPGKRPSFYDKWKAKLPSQHPIAMKKSSLKNTSSPDNQETHISELPFQQQIQMNKAKAKERDERDLLQQVINTVQDCVKEMKFTLHSVKEKLEHQYDHSGGKIEQTISTFLEDLCKYQDKILESVMEKDTNSSKVHSLEVDIAMKDAKIVALEKAMEGLQADYPESIVKAIRGEINEPHQRIEMQVQQILDWTKENAETQKLQFLEHKKRTEQQIKHCDQLCQSQEESLQQIEKRVLDELATLQRELKRKDTSYKRECSDQLRSFQERQIHEIESLIQRLFEEYSHMSFEQRNELKMILKGELLNISKEQSNNLEKFFQDRLNNHFHTQEKRLEEMFSKLSSTLENNENSKQYSETGSFLSLPQFEERMGWWNEDFKKQLERLHEQHMAEIKRLQAVNKQSSVCFPSSHQNTQTYCMPFQPLQVTDINDKRRERPDKWPDKRTPDLTGLKCSDSDANLQRHECFGFKNLGASQFNTKSLFSRPVFSPVATVLPQIKEVQIADKEGNYLEKVGSSEVRSMKINKMPKKKRNKKRYIFTSKKKKKKITLLPNSKSQGEMEKDKKITDVSEDTVINARTTRSKSAILLSEKSKVISAFAEPVNATKQKDMSVYNFVDNEDNLCFQPKVMSQNKGCQNNQENRHMTSLNKLFNSPEVPFEECSSTRNSSPSLSITEMVIKRKIRCKKDSQFDGDETASDILSTPNMVLYNETRQWNFQQNFMMHPQEPKVFRRSGEKRKLCDVNLDLISMELANLFRKKQKPAIKAS